jgi:hypothetical protein
VDDWRRSQGRAPVKRRNGRRPCDACVAAGRFDSGGACDLCNGNGVWCEGSGIPPDITGEMLNWQASVRLGRRLLAALEGQPSECQRCEGRAWTGSAWQVPPSQRPCPDCHGTGHNLHGVLPPVRDSEQAVVKAADAFRTASRDSRGRSELVAAWQGEVINRDRRRINLAMSKPTRVVPRGEHRNEQRMLGAWLPGRNVAHRLRPNLDGRIESRMSLNGFRNDFCDHAKLPRWRRGELKHAEQRRARGVVLSRETTPFVDDDGNPNAITMTVRLSPSPEPAA